MLEEYANFKQNYNQHLSFYENEVLRVQFFFLYKSKV